MEMGVMLGYVDGVSLDKGVFASRDGESNVIA
jgi:hypothetical protein